MASLLTDSRARNQVALISSSETKPERRPELQKRRSTDLQAAPQTLLDKSSHEQDQEYSTASWPVQSPIQYCQMICQTRDYYLKVMAII